MPPSIEQRVNGLRSVVAIGAGFFATSVLPLIGDFALRRLMPDWFAADGRVQDSSALIITLIYTALSGVVGGYVAARIAIRRPLLHAGILGGVMLALTALYTAAVWSTSAQWFHLATLAMVLPAALLGGKIRELQGKQP